MSETENQAQYYMSLRAERFASEACTLFVLGTFLLGYNSVLLAKASVALQTLPTHSGYINDQGFCHVVGEGENTRSNTLANRRSQQCLSCQLQSLAFSSRRKETSREKCQKTQNDKAARAGKQLAYEMHTKSG